MGIVLIVSLLIVAALIKGSGKSRRRTTKVYRVTVTTRHGRTVQTWRRR